jgi:hypothetical protein
MQLAVTICVNLYTWKKIKYSCQNVNFKIFYHALFLMFITYASHAYEIFFIGYRNIKSWFSAENFLQLFFNHLPIITGSYNVYLRINYFVL